MSLFTVGPGKNGDILSYFHEIRYWPLRSLQFHDFHVAKMFLIVVGLLISYLIAKNVSYYIIIITLAVTMEVKFKGMNTFLAWFLYRWNFIWDPISLYFLCKLISHFSCRYISIAEIIDISSLVSSSLVRVIDLRDFVSIWCGISLDLACVTDTKLHSPVSKSLNQCGSLLAGLHGSIEKCIYAVNDDCRTTVWTYNEDGHGDGMLDSFQPDEKLKQKKKISYVRTRKDVFKTLGPGSEAESASLLAFGTLFSAPYKGSELYVDIRDSNQNQRFLSLKEETKLLSFVPEILIAGKEFAKQTIRAPFLCAQLRLLDGQFKNHQKATFQGLKQKLESLRKEGTLPIHIFIMTDLPGDNWTNTYLGDLVRENDKYMLYFLKENDKLIKRAAIKLITAGHGQRFLSNSYSTIGKKYCSSQRLPDLLLYVEQTVCSCASLGFVGTPGSTIAENIELMRKFGSSSQKCWWFCGKAVNADRVFRIDGVRVQSCLY